MIQNTHGRRNGLSNPKKWTREEEDILRAYLEQEKESFTPGRAWGQLQAEGFSRTAEAIRKKVQQFRKNEDLAKTSDPKLIAKLISLVNKQPREIEEVCNLLDVSPKKARNLISVAVERGYTIRIAENGFIHPTGLQPRTSKTSISLPKVSSTLRWAVFSDLHFGSRFCLEEEVADFATYVHKEEGINLILNAGDSLDGQRVYRGHEFELKYHGFAQQSDRLLMHLPEFPDLHYAFIDGNHDASFWKLSGLEPGAETVNRAVARGRTDLTYLGPDQAQVVLGEGDQGVIVEIAHPDKAGAYAKSYHIQKYVEALQSGSEPQILFTGHEHDYLQIEVAGIFCAKCCTFQSQTPYMARKSLRPALGGLIIEIKVSDDYQIREWSCRRISYNGPKLKRHLALPVRKIVL